jgi:hypothetical protein
MRRRRKPLVLLLVGSSKGLAFKSRRARLLAKARDPALEALVLAMERSGLL